MNSNPPRIAVFLATSGHSGVDRLAAHLIPEMARRGFRVDLLRVRGHGPFLQANPSGVREIEFSTRHVYSALPSLVRYLRQARPDVIFSDKDRVNRTVLLARLIAGVSTRVVVSQGSTISLMLAERKPLDRFLQKQSMGHLYRLADQVVVTCEDVADDMSAYTGLPRRMIQAPPPPVVPASLFSGHLETPDHPWFTQHDKPLILGVGELCLRKDFYTLVRAVAEVRKKLDCRLMILGEGKHRPQLQALVHELGLDAMVQMPGFVGNPYSYMAHADVFVHPSTMEGLGFVIIEALAVGTPVVATRCPSGPREILRDGAFGPLVPVGDHRAMADAILQVLENPLPAEALREAARPYEVGAATSGYLAAMGLPPFAGEIEQRE